MYEILKHKAFEWSITKDWHTPNKPLIDNTWHKSHQSRYLRIAKFYAQLAKDHYINTRQLDLMHVYLYRANQIETVKPLQLARIKNIAGLDNLKIYDALPDHLHAILILLRTIPLGAKIQTRCWMHGNDCYFRPRYVQSHYDGVWIDGLLRRATQNRYDYSEREQAFKFGGCGYSASNEIAYMVSRTIFGLEPSQTAVTYTDV